MSFDAGGAGGIVGDAAVGLLDPQHDGGQVTDNGATWKMALKSFAENKLALIGIFLIVFFILFSFVGPHVYHPNANQGNLEFTDLPPQKGWPLGSDDVAYDNLYQLMKGGQSALEIGFIAALIASVLGTLWGAAAGLIGGPIDGLMMRLVDVGLAIPTLFIILIIAVALGSPTVLSLALVIGLNQWLVPARLIRAEVLTLRERDFVSAARTMGSSKTRLMLRHLIPNAFGTVIVNTTFQIADAILFTSVVGFLGFGLNFPLVDWGDQLSNGVTYLLDGYWWLIYPVGIALVLLIMSFNFIGDAARDAIDVRLRKR